MRKCLSKYKPFLILSDYDLLIKTYILRTQQLFKDLQCQIHEHDSIIALCIDENCQEYQKILCLRCIISDHQHQHNILLIQDIQIKRDVLFKLLKYLQNPIHTQPNQNEFKWLQESIIDGQDIPYPSLSFENVFATMQETFVSNMDDLRSQVEKSVHSVQSNISKLKKIQQFKQRMDDIIKQTQSQIYLNFQSILMEENSEQKSTEAKSLPNKISQTLNLSQIEYETQEIQELSQYQFTPRKDTIEEQQQIIKQQQDDIIPLMPTLQMIDSTKKRSFIGKPKVKFTEGDKIIQMEKNTIIISKESFNVGIVEFRIRMQCFISGCFHLGTVEETTYQLTKSIDNVGFWACLDGNCNQPTKLSKLEEFNLTIDSVVALNLNFIDDIIQIKLFTREAILILFTKKGCLMKQKQRIFISNYSNDVKLEMLN